MRARLTLLADRKRSSYYARVLGVRRGKRRWEVGAIRYAGKRSHLCQSVANASVRNADKFPEELSGKMLDVISEVVREINGFPRFSI